MASRRTALSWTAAGSEARQLADAVRDGRLNVLCGGSDAERARLLVDGVLPLLRRAQGAEWVIHLDDWGDGSDCTTLLHAAIDDTMRRAGAAPAAQPAGLAERVRHIGSRHGARLLFVLDGFDTVLRARSPLLDELARTLDRREPAHLLLGMRGSSEPLLASFTQRLESLDGEMFRLEDEPPVARRLHLVASPKAIYADIEAQLASLDDAPVDTPAAADTTVEVDDLLAPPPSAGPSAAMQAWSDELEARRTVPVATFAAATVEPAPSMPPARRVGRWHGPMLGALVVVALGIVGLAVALRDEGAAVTAPVSVPGPAPVAPPAPPPPPTLDLAVASEDGAVAPPVRALITALANDPDVRLRAVPETSAAPLAIVRYDALQHAAAAGGSAPLAVVAPLYTEELQVVVRADAPWRALHEIEGLRLDIGAADGARALTARHLHQQLFARALPADRESHLAAGPALRRLAEEPTPTRGFDAVLLVGPAPGTAWNGLTPAQRQQLRVLRYDATNPVARRAQRTYLAARIADPTGATDVVPTLAALSFLVVGSQASEDERRQATTVAQALCRALPALQRTGDPKWREVRPGLQVETPWQPASAAAAAWSACASTLPATIPSNPAGAPR